MIIGRSTLVLALLACIAPARAQNLPGSEQAAAPLDIAAQNRAAAALREQYRQNRAAYEAALRAHAAQAGDPAAYAETLTAYHARIADTSAPATVPARTAPAPTCAAVTGRTYTGSLVSREPTRRRCAAPAR